MILTRSKDQMLSSQVVTIHNASEVANSLSKTRPLASSMSSGRNIDESRGLRKRDVSLALPPALRKFDSLALERDWVTNGFRRCGPNDTKSSHVFFKKHETPGAVPR